MIAGAYTSAIEHWTEIATRAERLLGNANISGHIRYVQYYRETDPAVLFTRAGLFIGIAALSNPTITGDHSK